MNYEKLSTFLSIKYTLKIIVVIIFSLIKKQVEKHEAALILTIFEDLFLGE